MPKKVCNKKGKKEEEKNLEILLKVAERIFVYRCDPASKYLESTSGGALEVGKNRSVARSEERQQ